MVDVIDIADRRDVRTILPEGHTALVEMPITSCPLSLAPSEAVVIRVGYDELFLLDSVNALVGALHDRVRAKRILIRALAYLDSLD